MKWIKATERLGVFQDSDIPDWKFWHPGFCKVDGKPAEGGFFRKDTTNKWIHFSHVYIPGSQFREEIKEKNFDRIEWLDESPSVNDPSVLKNALEQILNGATPLNGPEYFSWIQTARQIASDALAQSGEPDTRQEEEHDIVKTESELLSKCLNMLRYLYMNEYCGEHGPEVFELIKAKQ